MDELKVNEELKKEIFRWCETCEYCGSNVVFLSAKNKLSITYAIVAILNANPEFIISTMDTTTTRKWALETTVQFIKVGFTGG